MAQSSDGVVITYSASIIAACMLAICCKALKSQAQANFWRATIMRVRALIGPTVVRRVAWQVQQFCQSVSRIPNALSLHQRWLVKGQFFLMMLSFFNDSNAGLWVQYHLTFDSCAICPKDPLFICNKNMLNPILKQAQKGRVPFNAIQTKPQKIS